MEKLIITGGKPLQGEITVSGAKNMAMKAITASLLTSSEVIIHNIPLISSVLGTTKIVKPLGVKVKREGHTLTLSSKDIRNHTVPLELGGLYRTAPMVMGPLLARFGKAVVPNPGGCRLGKRPVDWHVQALEQLGAKITYKDGYFYGEAKKLTGGRIHFAKNTHTGTETALLAAVLAEGETSIENAAAEPEIDDLIKMLVGMGARIKRNNRTIIVDGVKKLHGVTHTVMPDRNEVVTYALAALATRGNILIHGTQRAHLLAFLKALDDVGAGWEAKDETTTRFYWKQQLKPTQITTAPYPGFMTDWQQPWAVLATQTEGVSTIHETVFESRFSYVLELTKMGAKIEFYNPDVPDPADFYNFNWNDRIAGFCQAIRIYGPTRLHEAILEMTDIRAGATLVVAALAAHGTSVLQEIDHLDRGYENVDTRLKGLGANIRRIKEEV